ncbi:hypothetical protein GGS26DRAFT_554316 [Hypomontagnella submonticulosa]|nr:hypothetical protein GGS26DRAFT_554316 [Hypomontagnella submonticulosa]
MVKKVVAVFNAQLLIVSQPRGAYQYTIQIVRKIRVSLSSVNSIEGNINAFFEYDIDRHGVFHATCDCDLSRELFTRP